MKLWYKAPAREWLEGLPIGTGPLAAMVLGTFRRERIALNHECLWKGGVSAPQPRRRGGGDRNAAGEESSGIAVNLRPATSH